MKELKKIVFFSLALTISTTVAAEDVAIIVNNGNSQELTKQDVAAIYSDDIIQWRNGSRIRSYDLPETSDVRETFSREVLGMSTADTIREWANRKITNSAKNAPKERKERLVLLTVKRNANAIGYVSASSAKGATGIRVVMTIED